MHQPRSLHLGPIDLSYRITRNPDFRWRRFTLRGLMLLVLVMAVLSTLLVARFRAQPRPRFIRTYPVADLVGRVDLDRRFRTIDGVARAVRDDIPADRWAPEPRRVTPFSMSLSLTVDDTEEGLQPVDRYFDRLRKRGR